MTAMTTGTRVRLGSARLSPLQLSVLAATVSLLAVAAALTAHALALPTAVWLTLAGSALAVRPLAILQHRRHRDGL